MKIIFNLILFGVFSLQFAQKIIDDDDQLVDLIKNANENSDETELFVLVAVPLSCKTVSGPKPGRDCIFPFKWNGQTFNSCPVDPDDKSKRWCSTKVDSNGNHVPNQNEYGHCGSFCPAHIESPRSPTQSKFYLDNLFMICT